MNKKQWYIERWNALGDLTDILKAADSKYTNPKTYFDMLILGEPNEKLAELRLEMLEKVKNIDKDKEQEILLQKLRNERFELLAKSDCTQLSDFPISPEERVEWRKYRKYLRDLPSTYNNNYTVMTYIEWSKWRKDNKYRLNLE